MTNDLNRKYGSSPAGRYGQYEEKMRRLKKRIDIIRKHKVMIIAFAAVFFAIAAAVTFCAGIFTGGMVCESYVYGEEPVFSTNAFMAKVRYEFADTDTGVWNSALPTEPGEYRVRGITENIFGIRRESEEGVFSVLPRQLELEFTDSECVYGELCDTYLASILQADGLAKGDSLTDTVFEYNYEAWNNVNISVDSFRIINSDGNDVTSAYICSADSRNITLKQRQITVTISGAVKEYDGNPWNGAVYSIPDSALAEGDLFEAVFPEYPADAGSYDIAPESYKITGSDGKDISYKYNVGFVYGTLTVNPRPLHFTTGSAEKTYDGTPLTCDEWELVSGTLAEGHLLSAITVGTRTASGTGKNILSVAITDKAGNYYTSNYDITVDTGTLTIDPIILTFTTDSAEKVYDGTELTARGYKHISGELLPQHTMSCRTNGSIVDAGTAKNTLLVAIYNTAGYPVTENGYEIVVECGTLEITQRPITIVSGSAEKLYDGTPLTCHEYSVYEGSFAYGDTAKVNYTGSQTDVGESLNKFTLTISNSRGNATRNYKITCKYGKLKVLPNENYVPGDGGENGNNGGGNGASGNNGGGGSGSGAGGSNGENNFLYYTPGAGVIINYPGVSENAQNVATVKLTGNDAKQFGAYLRAVSYGDYTGRGFTAAKDGYVDVTSSLDFIGSAVSTYYDSTPWYMYIERLPGCPVIIPYYSCNTSIFGRSDVYFTSEMTAYNYPFIALDEDIAELEKYENQYFSREKEDYSKYAYETYLQIPESTKQALLRIGEQAGIGVYGEYDVYKLAMQIQELVRGYGTYNSYGTPYPEDADVAVYFFETAREGICQHFAAAATMMYRAYGIPARYVVGYWVQTVPDTTVNVTTEDGHAWVEIYIDDLGWVPVEVTASGNGSIGTKTDITVTSYSAVKEYDGKIFDEWNNEKANITSGYLHPGHTMKVEISEARNNYKPGIYFNTITDVKIYDSNGNDVTDKYYNVHTDNGTMTIKKRRIVISMGSATKKFDGQPLKCEEWTKVSGTFLPNTQIYIETSSEITEPGKKLNEAKYVRVYENINGVFTDVSTCYSIEILPGILEITDN